MKKCRMVALSALFLVGLAGCGANDADNGRMGTNTVRTNEAGDTQRLRVSVDAARSVEWLDDVIGAHVIISNNNAYVAINMDKGTTRTQGYRTSNEGKNERDTGTLGNPGYHGVRGFGDGTRNGEYGGTGIGGGNADGFGQGNDNRTALNFDLGNGNGKGREPSRATIVTDQSAEGLSKAFQKKIAGQVKKAEPEPAVNRIYISINPEFYMRMNRFADDINNGQSGIYKDFRATIGEVFEKQ